MSERLYDYTLQRETGDASNFYWGNVNKRLTLTELEEAYNSEGNGQLRKAFGSFDNYLAYMNERQDLIDAGDLKADWWNTGQPLVTDDQLASKQVDDRTQEGMLIQAGVQQGEIGYNAQAEVQEALYQKYTGEQGNVHYNSDGDTFRWNGSSYVKTAKVDDHAYGSMVGNALPGIVLSAGLAGPLGGMLGNATGSAAVGKGIAAGVANAGGQYIATGDVDPRSVVSSAVIGGLNPGGALGDKIGLVPDNVTAGFLQGATNSALGDLIATGDVDLQGALIAGGIGAGTNAIKDLFSDADQFSIESEMNRIATERELQGLPPLTTEELYQEAMFGNMTGRSDLGGLIGDDGLLSFIPTVKTGGLNNLLGGGYFDPNAVFTGPDGKKYTDVELLQQGIDPSDVFAGGVDGWSYSASSGFWAPAKGDGNGLLSDNGFLDALAEQEFENQYGMTPTDFLAGGGTIDQLKQMIAYGPLDETYNWSDNPRGDSQYVGLLTGLADGYSKGSVNDERGYQAGDGGIKDALDVTNYQDTAANAPDPNSSVAIINLGDGETAVNANATLPGSNITVVDAITQGLIDGILVSDDDLINGSVPGDKDETASTVSGATPENADISAGDDQNAGGDLNGGGGEDQNAGGDTNGSDLDTAIDSSAVVTGSNVDTAIDTNTVISGSDDLTSSTSGGNSSSDLGITFSGKDGLPPLWTELFGYTKISPYKKARLKVLEGMLTGIAGGGVGNFNAFEFGVNKDPYQKIAKSLYEAGIK